MAYRMERGAYALTYGPTAGDRIRLADTNLVIQVEKDLAIPGEEVKFGGGKTIRDGMGQSQRSRAEGAMDTVITNAVIVDHWGIVKADVGLKDGRIAAIGKAGNPDTQPGIDILIGPGTEIIAGEGRLLTAGGIDAHIHWICPQQADEAIYSGVTTMIGGGTGPAEGTSATTCTPGPWHIGRMLRAIEGLPVNVGLLGKGNASRPAGLDGDGGGRRLRPQAARGLGHHAQRHRLLPGGGGRDGRAGRHPHRHAERIRLRRAHHRGVQGPRHPRLSHRRRRRRPRAGHPQGLRPAERAALLHQSDAALHGQHAGRASRHADGLPPSGCAHSRRTWPSPRAASGARPSRPRTCCTTSARSA